MMLSKEDQLVLATFMSFDVENGGGNKNGNPNRNDICAIPVARECTYHDFMKCQSLNFKGTEGVVGLKRWFEKMEIVFHISNYPERELMKLMTEVYCPRNEIQKMESELWNLTVKNNDLAAYTQRFQELTIMCTKIVLEEEDQPTSLQDAVRIANNLMDQKLKGYDVKNAKNKRRAMYSEMLKCNKVGHITRDCINVFAATATQRAPILNQRVHTCFDCRRQGHYRNECPKLKDQTRRNKAGKKTNKARGKAYVLGGGEANPDSNVVTGMFLLNNHYASMLFDSGADRSFVSSTFSALLDVILSTLDVSYAV
ncbi:putative reverse transcriptase domain-containing protein [Tanacetum coccineum]